MKILFLTNRLPHAEVAGGHKLIYQRMQMLKKRKHWIGLVSLTKEENLHHINQLQNEFDFIEAIPHAEPTFIRRVFNDYLNPVLPAIYWKNYSKKMMKLVGDAVQKNKCDLVIAEFSEMGQYLYKNPHLSAVHKIVSCHRCLSDTFNKYVLTKGVPLSIRLKSAAQIKRLIKYEFEMYSAMDNIITLTPEDRYTLLNESPQLPVTVIAPGIDIDYLNNLSNIRKKSVSTLLMCGYFFDKSNRDAALWFIRSIWPIIKRKNSNIICQFVGKGIENEIKQAADKDPSIELISDVDDLRPYRKGADIFVNPMRLGSGLRIKLLEAMGSGLPVVTTSLGAAGIPAQNGLNCFINDTPKGFADSICWLLNDKDLANNMGNQAKQMIESIYEENLSILNLERIYYDTISKVTLKKNNE